MTPMEPTTASTLLTPTHAASLSSLSLAIQIHLVCALAATALGPLALWSRKGSTRHRWSGRVWVLLMIGAALTSLFIRDFRLPNLGGYTPIHLLPLLTAFGLTQAIRAILRRDIATHRQTMRSVYIGGCLIAGSFTLLPGRYLGDLLWHHAFGLI